MIPRIPTKPRTNMPAVVFGVIVVALVIGYLAQSL